MKTSILFLFIVGISFFSFAQSELQLKEFPKFNFNKEWQKDSVIFKFSPNFQSNSKNRRLKFPETYLANSLISKDCSFIFCSLEFLPAANKLIRSLSTKP